MHCLAPNTCGDGTGCDNMTAIIVRFSSTKLCSSGKRTLSPEERATESVEILPSKKIKILAETLPNEQEKE